MKDRIAWIRLITYLGNSIILVTEIYRLILIYLRFIISIPSLFFILELIMHWALLGGFLSIILGFHGLKKSDPVILNPKEYSFSLLNKIIYIGCFIVIILFIQVLLPPSSIIIGEFKTYFQLLVNILWICYYLCICLWIISFWSFSNKKEPKEIVNNRILVFHLCLGSLVVILSILNFFWILFSNNSLFNNDLAYISYIIVLVFFLVFQIIFFYRATKFSFVIHG
ncbi:MAG: hypothetical protein ACFFB5_04760 [Promethearchaeota archaeon]